MFHENSYLLSYLPINSTINSNKFSVKVMTLAILAILAWSWSCPSRIFIQLAREEFTFWLITREGANLSSFWDSLLTFRYSLFNVALNVSVYLDRLFCNLKTIGMLSFYNYFNDFSVYTIIDKYRIIRTSFSKRELKLCIKI